jgi:hypothetical protein
MIENGISSRVSATATRRKDREMALRPSTQTQDTAAHTPLAKASHVTTLIPEEAERCNLPVPAQHSAWHPHLAPHRGFSWGSNVALDVRRDLFCAPLLDRFWRWGATEKNRQMWTPVHCLASACEGQRKAFCHSIRTAQLWGETLMLNVQGRKSRVRKFKWLAQQAHTTSQWSLRFPKKAAMSHFNTNQLERGSRGLAAV